MPRHHMTAEGPVPFTAEEEAQRNAEEAQALVEQTALAKTQYQRQRATEYPPMADYLDGIVKGNTEQMQTYIDACLAVKAKYPKPE